MVVHEDVMRVLQLEDAKLDLEDVDPELVTKQGGETMILKPNVSF